MRKTKHILLFIVIAIYQLVLTGIFMSFSVGRSASALWLLLIIMNLVVDLIIFFFIKQLEKKQFIEAQLVQLSASRKREMKRYREIETQLKNLREQRHEFANQMQTAYMMIGQNAPTKQIEQYLSNILDNIT